MDYITLSLTAAIFGLLYITYVQNQQLKQLADVVDTNATALATVVVGLIEMGEIEDED